MLDCRYANSVMVMSISCDKGSYSGVPVLVIRQGLSIVGVDTGPACVSKTFALKTAAIASQTYLVKTVEEKNQDV